MIVVVADETELEGAEQIVGAAIRDAAFRAGGVAVFRCHVPENRGGAVEVDALVCTPQTVTILEVKGFTTRQEGTLATPPNGPWTVDGAPAALYHAARVPNPFVQVRRQVFAAKSLLQQSGIFGWVNAVIALVPQPGAEITIEETRIADGYRAVIVDRDDFTALHDYFEAEIGRTVRLSVEDVARVFTALNLAHLLPSTDDLTAQGFPAELEAAATSRPAAPTSSAEIGSLSASAATHSEAAAPDTAHNDPVGPIQSPTPAFLAAIDRMANRPSRSAPASDETSATAESAPVEQEPAGAERAVEAEKHAPSPNSAEVSTDPGSADERGTAAVSPPTAPPPGLPDIERTKNADLGAAPDSEAVVAHHASAPPPGHDTVNRDDERSDDEVDGRDSDLISLHKSDSGLPRRTAPEPEPPAIAGVEQDELHEDSSVRHGASTSSSAAAASWSVPSSTDTHSSNSGVWTDWVGHEQTARRPSLRRRWRDLRGGGTLRRTAPDGPSLRERWQNRPVRERAERGRRLPKIGAGLGLVLFIVLFGAGFFAITAVQASRFEMSDYDRMCGPDKKPFPNAAPYQRGDVAPIYLSGHLTTMVRPEDSPAWRPTDPATVQLIACMKQLELRDLVQTCQYGPAPGAPVGRTVNLFRATYEVIVYELRTGREVAKATMLGERYSNDPANTDPDRCRAAGDAPDYLGRRLGQPSGAQVENFLAPLVHARR
ncbi:nuclease-related domain-containing protein [Nocardia caishijiensis]|uniref:Nuclease-like protein n=1 Tax=Nocardia caishijiensis TaxID=184756 RepID=A0ABQ6YNS7_9NOCA|nr:nuclease-related domain-containing protein [Nocardia caishijiensis]KAF0847457.1 nuclease-like protein [Nocardia caishijiensis]